MDQTSDPTANPLSEPNAPDGGASTHEVQPSAPADAKMPTPDDAAEGLGIKAIVQSLLRLVDIRYRIWLTRAKLTALRLALFATLWIVALLVGVLAIVFLYIGLFRVFTDFVGIPTAWAFLIFGGVHAIVAAVLAFIGVHWLSAKDTRDKKPPTSATHEDAKPESN